MWVWLILSLIVLGACIIFALRIFFGNYGVTSFTENYFPSRVGTRKYEALQQEKLAVDVRNKLQVIEDNSVRYINQLDKIQRRLDELERSDPADRKYKKQDDDNWKELYESLLAEKESLEDQYNTTKIALEETELKLYEAEKKETILSGKKSLLESELEEAYSLQNKIGELQRELEGATEREKELHHQLEDAKNIKLENKMLQTQYNQLKIEADDLKNRVQEVNSREALLQQKIKRLNELESSFEMSEQEKNEMKKSIEDIILENGTLAAKLQQLQSKLSDEKYA